MSVPGQIQIKIYAITRTTARLQEAVVYTDPMAKFTAEKALLWADVTEFTLAMEASEQVMAKRTLAWVDRCVNDWLGLLQGRLLQQSGDAMLLAFADAEQALAATRRLRIDWINLAPSTEQLGGHELRVALHWGRVLRGKHGYVAHHINQLARLASQVAPAQVWVSSEFRQQLPEPVQAQCDDLGWMHFKHLDAPLQVFRYFPERHPDVQHWDPVRLPRPMSDRPRLLVQNLDSVNSDEWIDAVVHAIRADAELEVARLADTPHAGDDLRHIRADFLLRRLPTRAGWMQIEMLSLPHGLTVFKWAGQTQSEHQIEPMLSQELQRAWRQFALSVARCQPTTTMSLGLLSYASVNLMLRGDQHDYERAIELFQTWHERTSRSANPLVWTLLWHVLGRTRGLSDDRHSAVHLADKALLLEPDHAHAWAARGFARAHLQGDWEEGMRDLERAQSLDPNLHWVSIYRSVLCCMAGDPQRALSEAKNSLKQMSALCGYTLGLAGHAAVYAGQLTLATQWLETSWREQPLHSPTLRMLVVAHQMQGEPGLARFFMRQLRQLEPRLTAANYLLRTRYSPLRRAELADCMVQAGLPPK